MPSGSVSYAKDRLVGRCHIRAPEDEFPRRLSRISLDCHGGRGLRKDSIHLPESQLSLYCNAFWAEEHRATYQQMMTKMFQDKLGRMVEVYIVDMVVKSKQELWHMEDL